MKPFLPGIHEAFACNAGRSVVLVDDEDTLLYNLSALEHIDIRVSLQAPHQSR